MCGSNEASRHFHVALWNADSALGYACACTPFSFGVNADFDALVANVACSRQMTEHEMNKKASRRPRHVQIGGAGTGWGQVLHVPFR